MQQFENANKDIEVGTQMFNYVRSRNSSESDAKNARSPENSTQFAAEAGGRERMRACSALLSCPRYYPSKGQRKQCCKLTGVHFDLLRVVSFSSFTSGVNRNLSEEKIFTKVVEQSFGWYSTLNYYVSMSFMWFALS